MSNLGTNRLDYEIYGTINKLKYTTNLAPFWIRDSAFKPSSEALIPFEKMLDGDVSATVVNAAFGAGKKALALSENAENPFAMSSGQNAFEGSTLAKTDKVISGDSDMDEDDIDNGGMPLFIREFLEMEQEDAYYINLRNEWLDAKEKYDNNRSDEGELTEIRQRLIRKSCLKYSDWLGKME